MREKCALEGVLRKQQGARKRETEMGVGLEKCLEMRGFLSVVAFGMALRERDGKSAKVGRMATERISGYGVTVEFEGFA
jgi:hypothetical protein